MQISHIDQFVYAANPKTGTRSVMRFLEDNFLTEKNGEHGVVVPPEAKDYFTFTTIRNPYDRAVSIWWATCKRDNHRVKYQGLIDRGLDKSFNLFMEFLLDTLNKTKRPPKCLRVLGLSQHHFLRHFNRIDMYCRMENLEQELSNLPFYSKATKPLRHLNKTINQREAWRQYVDADSIKMVEEWVGDDFEFLGYERES